MPYILRRSNGLQLDGQHDAVIVDALKAQQYINGHLEYEENFNSAVQAFLNLEQRALNSALGNLLRRNAIAADPHEVISEFNGDFYSFLFATKAYVDKTKKWLSNGFGGENGELAAFDNYRRDEHSESFSYRLIEILRNHAQHAGFALTGLHVPREIGRNETNTSCSPVVSRDILLEDKDFAKVAEELRRKPRSYPILPAVRAYISCLSRVHDKLRNDLQPRLDRARAALFLPLFNAGVEEGVILIAETDASGKELTKSTIWAAVPHRIEALRTRNPSMDYSKLVVQSYRGDP